MIRQNLCSNCRWVCCTLGCTFIRTSWWNNSHFLGQLKSSHRISLIDENTFLNTLSISITLFSLLSPLVYLCLNFSFYTSCCAWGFCCVSCAFSFVSLSLYFIFTWRWLRGGSTLTHLRTIRHLYKRLRGTWLRCQIIPHVRTEPLRLMKILVHNPYCC